MDVTNVKNIGYHFYFNLYKSVNYVGLYEITNIYYLIIKTPVQNTKTIYQFTAVF